MLAVFLATGQSTLPNNPKTEVPVQKKAAIKTPRMSLRPSPFEPISPVFLKRPTPLSSPWPFLKPRASERAREREREKGGEGAWYCRVLTPRRQR
jgi:hypothetical protein